MTKLNDALNRLLVLIVGLIALFGGALTIALYVDVGIAQRFIDMLQPRRWSEVPHSPWFLFGVGAGGVVFLILGVLGLAFNLQRNRIRLVDSAKSSPLGSISFDISEIADAAAETFTEFPKVIRSRAVVKRDRGQKVLIITVDSEASVQLAALTAHAEQVEQDLSEAIGDPSLHTVFRFHVAPVERL